MSGHVFEDVWRVTCLGGFIAGREAAKRLAALGQGTLVFTGATASIKARPPFLAFASAKAGLRAVAAGLAREFGPKNVHVGHVIIDGGVDGAIRRKRIPADAETAGENEILSPDAIAESYWQLHLQHRSAWSFEIDLRPFSEVF
jgi:NAD(P)-dependent dehydrogenase (short-subunit alcohol dehydrogenase family)